MCSIIQSLAHSHPTVTEDAKEQHLQPHSAGGYHIMIKVAREHPPCPNNSNVGDEAITGRDTTPTEKGGRFLSRSWMILSEDGVDGPTPRVPAPRVSHRVHIVTHCDVL